MTLFLRADAGDVHSHHFCEIPITGPGLANRLVTITGVAISSKGDGKGLDIESDQGESDDVKITTDYHLGKDDKLLDSAPYVSLAGVNADDEDAPGTVSGFVFAIDDIFVGVDEIDARAITLNIKVGLQGDAAISQIAYQANIVIQKAAG